MYSGFSSGAFLTANIMAFNTKDELGHTPDNAGMLAGHMVFKHYQNMTKGMYNKQDNKFFMYIGTKDPLVKVKDVKKSAQVIEEMGADVQT